MKLTVDEIRRKTMELLGINDPTDVDYISQEMVDSDSKLGPEHEATPDHSRDSDCFGHNMRYGAVRINGVVYQAYIFNADNRYVEASACGNKATHWARMDAYDHVVIGKCHPRDAKLRFVLKVKTNPAAT